MQCTYSMLEMVNYYNFNKSNVFVLMLMLVKFLKTTLMTVNYLMNY